MKPAANLNKPGTIIAIELTNYCNISCSHCPQGKLNVPTGFMNRETFLQCLKHCNGYTELNWRGETLMHPNLIEYVRIAKEYDNTLNLGFHTNAILMTEKLFNGLVENCLNWIHVSLHSPKSCIKYKQMIEWNTKLKNPINIYAEVDNPQEELIARSFGLLDGMSVKYHIANWGGYLTDYRTIHHDPKKQACNCMFYKENKFVVAWNGMVNPCCWDYELLHCLGHVKDFEKIRHIPPYKLCSSCLWIIEPSDVENPILVMEGYKGFNIVLYKNKFYALAQVIGSLDLKLENEYKLLEYQESGKCVIGDSLEGAKDLVNQLVH